MLILKYILSTRNKKVFYLNNFGNHFRDFTYINDAVKIMITLIKKNFKNKHELFNISSNNPVSIKWILKILKNEFGSTLIKKRSRQRSEVYKTHGSNLKVIKVTNFKKFTNISVGLTNVIKWAKKNIHYIK